MKQKRRKLKKKTFLFLLFLTVFFTVFGTLKFLEQRFLPPLKEISHIQCKSMANQIINNTVLELLDETELTGQALLLENNENYTANTTLVNRFCALLSADIAEGLRDLPKEVIGIPAGAATQISFLANTGPEIPFTLMPVGEVSVDYKTDFSSVGINQINYKIWLYIAMEIQIVNPFYQESVFLERKIMLADLIFGGKVPEHYFQMRGLDEYLLTE